MARQVYGDPEAIERFRSDLLAFNTRLLSSTNRISAEVDALGAVWRDPAYTQFAGEFQNAVSHLQQYLSRADSQLQTLHEKARLLEDFQRT